MSVRTQAQPNKSIADRPLRPYRLIAGQHVQPDPRIPREQGESFEDWKVRAETKYFRGEVVESRINLAKKWPEKFVRADEVPSGRNPFESVPAPGETEDEFKRRMDRLREQNQSTVANAARQGFDPAISNVTNQQMDVSPSKPLESMNLKELMEFAAEEEIDIKGRAKSRDDVLAAIKAAIK